MKKLKSQITLSLFALFTMNLSVVAQEEQQTQTLLNSGGFENIGFFLAPTIGYGQMDGADVAIANFRGGVIINENLTIGGFYGLSINDIQTQSETVSGVYMDYRIYGGFLEYTTSPSELFHFTFPLFIGAGEVETDNDEGSAGFGEENFFLVEPGAFLEINLLKNVRFNVGATYRFVGEMNYRNLNQNDISGVTGQIGLKFGIFD